MSRKLRRSQAKSIGKGIGSPDEILRKAQVAAARGQTVQAINLCRRGLKVAGDAPVAVTLAQIWCQLAPKDAEAWNQIGVILMSRDENVAAGKAFAEAVRLDPKHAHAWNNYGNVLHKFGKLQEAETFLLEALKYAEKQDKPRIYANLSNIYNDRFEREKAFETCRKGYEAAPHDPVINTLMGNLSVELFDDKTARPYYEAALKHDPENLKANINMALLAERAREFETCKLHLKTAVDIYKRQGSSKAVRSAPALKYRLYAEAPLQGETLRNIVNLNDTGLVQPVDDTVGLIHTKHISTYDNEWELFDAQNVYLHMLFHLPTGSKRFVGPCGYNGKMILQSPEGREHRYTEPCILLGGCKNYYHWIIDTLPRLKAVLGNPELGKLPIIVNSDFGGFQIKTLEALGMDISRFQPAPAEHVLHFDEVYIPHIYERQFRVNGEPEYMLPVIPKWKVDWLHNMLGQYMTPRGDLPRRIFLSREGASFRQCLNEADIFALAQSYGFEKVKNEELDWTDQLALYAGAEAVFGVHGAGFTNTVFSKPGLKIIELYNRGAFPEFFAEMAKVCGHTHTAIAGNIIQGLPPLSPEFWNFEANMDEVRQALEKTMGAKP